VTLVLRSVRDATTVNARCVLLQHTNSLLLMGPCQHRLDLRISRHFKVERGGKAEIQNCEKLKCSRWVVNFSNL